MLSGVEHEKSLISSGPGLRNTIPVHVLLWRTSVELQLTDSINFKIKCEKRSSGSKEHIREIEGISRL